MNNIYFDKHNMYYGNIQDVNELNIFKNQFNTNHIIVESNDNFEDDKNQDIIKDFEYADTKIVDNIFKHIIIFTNSRDVKDNKTLANIYDAIENLKNNKCKIIPELHIFVAAKVDGDEDKQEIIIEDDKNKFVINEQNNTDTLIISRLGVQGEDECEHIIELLQDRGFLVLNPIRYLHLASNKYETACLLKRGEIPQPNFSLMTKDILYDDDLYINALKEVNEKYDENKTNDDISVVVKILNGHGGIGVFMCTCDKLKPILQLIFEIDSNQQLIIQSKEESDGDIRVHVLTLRNKQVILGAMKRVKINNDFRSNVSLGASIESVKLTPEQEQIALKCAKISHLPWCAVDIMSLKKGSNKKLGDNVVLELNSSPGTDGISECLNANIVNMILSNLLDPSQFYIQRKIVGYYEGVKVTFRDDISMTYLGKLDTGNGTAASVLEVGDYDVDEKRNKIKFKIKDKYLEFDIDSISTAHVGDNVYKRYVINVDSIQIGLRKANNVKLSVVKSRNKSSNILINRDLLSQLGYVVASDETHILTEKIEKLKII